MTPDPFRRPRRAKQISAPERDEIIAGLADIMRRFDIGPGTIGKFAKVASEEARP